MHNVLRNAVWPVVEQNLVVRWVRERRRILEGELAPVCLYGERLPVEPSCADVNCHIAVFRSCDYDLGDVAFQVRRVAAEVLQSTDI